MNPRVQTKKSIVSLVQANRDRIKAFGVDQFGLFGSFVRGQQNENSDVDVLVSFKPNCKTFDNFMHLAFFLEDLLGRRVELLTTESLSPYVGPHILKEVEYVALDA